METVALEARCVLEASERRRDSVESAGTKTAVGFGRLPAPGVDDRLVWGGDRQVRPASGRGASVLTHLMAGHVDPPGGARHLDLGLVWCTGQAWICVMYQERDRLRPIVDLTVLCRRPYAGSERAETACGAEKKGERRLATRRVRVRAGGSNPWTSACYERHSCFLTLSSRP